MKLPLHSYLIVLAMVLAAGLAAAAKPGTRIADIGPKVDLEAMVPNDIAGWTVDKSIVPIAPNPDLQAVIEKTYDQTLSRTYIDAQGYRIMLSIAYGGNQDKFMNTHRPEVCYPAQGFSMVGARDGLLALAGKTIPVRRLTATQGPRNEPITYWLVVGDDATSFGLQYRLTTIKYGLTGRIPDGMLVRVSSIDPDNARANRMQDEFIRALIANVSKPDRKRLLGAIGT